jgi:hypothetical protein
VSVGILGFIFVILGGNLLINGRDDEDTPVAAAPPAAPSSVERCPDYPWDPPAPPSAGTDHEWVQVGKVLAPQGERLGPIRDDPARACWAPGPAGAIAAGANWMAALTDPTTVRAVVETQTADSPGRDRLVQMLNTPGENGGSVLEESAAGSGDYAFRGWRILSEAPDRVTVSYVYSAPGRDLASAAVTVIRDEERNDWVVLPPTSGRMGDVIDPSVPSMTGYTNWSA